jgi:hypothetical protein
MNKEPHSNQLSASPEIRPGQHSSERRCIALNHRHEIDFWARELAATEVELREAVRKAGPVVEDVRRYIAVVRRYLGDTAADAGGTTGRFGGTG